jgi:enoyl-[acyl-carrier protein] reductase II
MRWRTRITELQDIQHPIVEGAMAALGTVELAVPVSNAGGLGTITAWMLRKPEKLRKAVWKARSIEERVPIIETAARTLRTKGIGGWTLSDHDAD